jgi:hypothetical protein
VKLLPAVRYAWLTLFITMALAACHKGSPGSVAVSSCSMDSLTNNQTGPVDIYFAGWRSTYPSNEFAVFWKNGVLTDLTDGSRFITANAVAIAGNDVYVGGSDFINNHAVAKYWKNGMIANLADTTLDSYVSSVAASGEDIYFAGYENDGAPVHLTDGKNEAQASAIAIWGGDSYVTGYENISGHNVPTYWKNGVAVRLTDGSNNAYSPAIYVAKQQ